MGRIVSPSKVEVPHKWFNILTALNFDIPVNLPPERSSDGVSVQLPIELVRQTVTKKRWVDIPAAVRAAYEKWRPTPLLRAEALEKYLDTPARIYYKNEGVNVSGSHKLNTAIAQAYYYHRAGVRRLVTATGAGQWGTAVAVACAMFGLECGVRMVGTSFHSKPYRRTMMELYGAEVSPSPDPITKAGRQFLANHDPDSGNMALAIAESLEDTTRDGFTRFCIGSGELYSILHQTIIGLEVKGQLSMLGEEADVIIGSLGAGSNFGGIAAPYIADNIENGKKVRCLSVEPSACPKLTRGEYRYDFTDSSGLTPMEKMYTLGHHFATPDIHAGGLRYHATSKLISALYHYGLVEAIAVPQTDVFASGALFLRTEGFLPAPESAHAVHGAVLEAIAARVDGIPRTIVINLSGHGYFDLAAYQSWHDGTMVDINVTDDEIRKSLSQIPDVKCIL
ncbi:MAG: TrpB-like pyridoxal phosphate-dependent enzyme [Propionibacteriaceae bacterium]|jgi:tryptophan synthase beta chain|nr:TrpB-like pyridoxal phosphate-dependent enzyme [Propionibacteriaceae bacterium]